MSATSTPGPWLVNSGCVVDSRGNIIATRHSRRHLEKPEGYGDIQPAEADRNTHLMAAAPELLGALLALLDNREPDQYLLDRCNAVIAKATE